jgi:RNA 2',3'-cyclic 3'-phosphodiesterase
LRVFIAALLPEEIRLRVSEYIESLKPNIEGAKWEKYEKLHVTLKFLGEAEESTAAQVSDTVENLCLKYSPFKMNITRFGGFPDLENPRVLFIGLSPNEELSAFQNDIERELEALGFKKDARRFIPHITAGRVKKRFGIKSPIPIAEKIAFDISEIGVIKSELNPKGSVYKPLRVFDLNG